MKDSEIIEAKTADKMIIDCEELLRILCSI